MTKEKADKLSKPFIIYPDNELFHSENVLTGFMFVCNDKYYFKPHPEGDCVYDLKDNIEKLE